MSNIGKADPTMVAMGELGLRVSRLEAQRDKLADLLVRATTWVDETDDEGQELLRLIRAVLTPTGKVREVA